MEDATVKKWIVTYTKHVKQKRKVYQDGFLELHTAATTKVMLYDDCEKLLECRLLKKDEAVSSGETLTFNAYLVDVGDPEGAHKPVTQLNFQGREKKVAEKPDLVHSHKLSNNSISPDRKKTRGKLHNLSPSRRIIRDFKKSELHKYGTPHSSPDTTMPSATEWQVLYTSQVTQKAKKYHDGSLRLSSCGSIGRQVFLCDDSKKVLSSRFLKKDEVIKSDESISFDGYLVDIGSRQSLVDLSVQGSNCKSDGDAERMNRRKNYPEDFKMSGHPNNKASQISSDTIESTTMEWEVLYTSHVTQKAKKYHDGFLRLATRGSWERQIMLYDAWRNHLDSRFLEKDEEIKSGESIAFAARFLVDVGEPKEKHELPVNLDVQVKISNLENAKIIPAQQDFIKPKKPVIKEKSQRNSLSVEAADLHLSNPEVVEIKLTARVPTKKPLRDAHQILSILQKPMALENIVGGCLDKSMKRPISFTEDLQVSDASPLHHSENSESLRTSVPHYSSENLDKWESSDFLSSRAISSSSGPGSQLDKDMEPENSKKAYREADMKWHDESCATSVNASRGPEGDEKENSLLDRVREMDDCPSFDLGI